MNVFMCIIEDYLQLRGLTKSYAPLIGELFKFKNYEDKIVINASMKRDIGKRIHATVGSIDNLITKLVEKDILIRIDRGMYVFCDVLKLLNFNDSNEAILVVEYKDEKKKISINVGGNEQ